LIRNCHFKTTELFTIGTGPLGPVRYVLPIRTARGCANGATSLVPRLSPETGSSMTRHHRRCK